MNRNLGTVIAATTIAVMFFASSAQGADPSSKCEAGKLKESSKYAACRLKAEAKAVLKGIPADYAKCEAKFADKWAKAESKAGAGVCPTEGDLAGMDARITTDAAEVATLLAGGSLEGCGNDILETGESCDGSDLGGADCTFLGFASGTLACTTGCGFDVAGCVTSTCGDGVVDAGEACDQGDLDGETCVSQGLFGEGLVCGAGCLLDSSACSITRYEDTGSGTVIDHATGLEWQKTDDSGGLTDKDNTYAYTDTGDGDSSDRDGTAFTEILDELNQGEASSGTGPTTGCYAGQCDWRLPLIEELATIVDCSFGNPCIDQTVFGVVNTSSVYWSTSTFAGFPDFGWILGSHSGSTGFVSKADARGVRAVRQAW